jgi:DNA modification methylase
MEFPDLSGAVPPLFLNLSNTLAVSQKKETMKAMKQNTKNSEADAATARDVNSGKKKVRRDAPQPHCIHDQKTTGKEFTGAGQASPVAADPSTPKQTDRIMTPQALQIQVWPIDRLIFYARNARRNDAAVPKMCSSIREFGFKVPVLARSDGEVVDGHLRLKAARKLGITEVPVILCDEWTPAQVKAFRLVVNRSVTWADWDDALLTLELQDLAASNFDLSLTGFDPKELDDLLIPDADDQANSAPPLPENPVSRLGDLWLCGNPRPRHRVLCGDATNPETVARLLGDRQPGLLVTDPPYGIALDSEWRDRAGLNGRGPAEASYMKHRTEGHTNTSISSDNRADWSEAFAHVPGLQVAYVWHASVFTREVLEGLLRIGFLYPQQIIWNKGRAVLTRTHYWYQHEPCWYVRKKNAPWFGKAGENSTVWDSASPKFIMGGSGEEKYDHPTQKPIELMQRPILNHTKRGELVYDPFLGSGTTLAAAEVTERVCYGLELDPKYVDVVVSRWQALSGEKAHLDGDGRTFDEIAAERHRKTQKKAA